MPSADFPLELQNVPLPEVGSSVSVSEEGERVEILKKRDEFLLTALSQFEAVPLGMVFMTTIAYESNDDLPTGWIFADGATYSKETYDRLWEEVSKRPNDYISSAEFNTAVDQTIYDGKYIDLGETFRVPNLNNTFIRTTTDIEETGLYLPDQIKSHQHAIVANPVNGLGVSGTTDDCGIAFSNKIALNEPVEFNSQSTAYNEKTDQDEDEVTETRPKSISYCFIIRAKSSNLLTDDVIDLNADELMGHITTLEPTPDAIPYADENGHIDVGWLDPVALVEYIREAILDNPELMSALADIFVKREEVSVEAKEDMVVRGTEEGKIKPEWIDRVPLEAIDEMFEDTTEDKDTDGGDDNDDTNTP